MDTDHKLDDAVVAAATAARGTPQFDPSAAVAAGCPAEVAPAPQAETLYTQKKRKHGAGDGGPAGNPGDSGWL